VSGGYRKYLTMWWQAANLTTSTPSFYTQDNPAADLGGGADVVSATQAISAAGLVAVQAVPSLIVGSAPGSGPYASCRDYLKITFVCENGSTFDYHVPAPVSGILTGAGLGTVDLANPLIVALVDAMIAGGADSSGSPVVGVRRGSRFRMPVGVSL
jgi:hypothetical protein